MKNNVVSCLTRFVILLMTFLVITPMVTAGKAGYSAMVMDVKGKAFALHAGANKSIDLGYLLYPGDSVETTKDASLTIAYLESGQEEQWPGGAKFIIEKNGSKPVPAKITKKAKIKLPQIESSQKGAMTMKGMKEKGSFALHEKEPPQTGSFAMKSMLPPQEENIELIMPNHLETMSPSNTRTIEERPMFRWTPIPSAQSYGIRLYSLSEKEPVWKRTIKDAELSFPSDVPSLKPGYKYEWVVEVFENGRVVTQKRSCFSLPPGNELVDIRKGIKNYREQMETKPTDTVTRLRFILFLEEHQLYDEAMEQYAILQRQHGESESLTKRRGEIAVLRNMACQDY